MERGLVDTNLCWECFWRSIQCSAFTEAGVAESNWSASFVGSGKLNFSICNGVH